MRADKYILPILRDSVSDANVSREVSISLIKSGGVAINGKKISKPSHDIVESDVIDIDFARLNQILYPFSFDNNTVSSEGSTNVIFENDFFIVVNKDTGVVVHPGAGIYTGTLIQKVFPDIIYSNDISYRNLGVVHRLDKDTSGVIILSKNRMVTNYLASLFEQRKVKKYYLALSDLNDLSKNFININEVEQITDIENMFFKITTEGDVKKLLNDPEIATDSDTLPGITELGENWYLINGFIYKNSRNTFKFVLDQKVLPSYVKRKTAILKLKPLFFDNKKVLFIIRLITGRTHQIRATLKELGVPILNDKLYSKSNTINEKVGELSRMYLHAFSISFEIPCEYIGYKTIKVNNENGEFFVLGDRLSESKTCKIFVKAYTTKANGNVDL